MAVTIPIISEFDGKGISKAIAEFKQLEGAGAKAKFALQKAAIPAAAALTGVAVAIGDATKAAIEDAKAQELLAQAIEKNTLAGEANVRAAEAYIEKTMMAAAVADDQLRPALAQLVQTTGDLTLSQDLLNMALDISAATGTDLGAATDALAKAYAGNTKALGTMVPAVRGLIKDGASLDQVMAALSATVGGAAAVAANSAEGQMKRLSITISETRESIGAIFLPLLEKLLPYLQQFAVFAQRNADTIAKVLVVVGGLAAAILTLNAVMKVITVTTAAFNLVMAMNPIGIIVLAVGALIAGFGVLVAKTGSVKNAFATMGNFVIGIFEDIGNRFVGMINTVIAGLNIINPFSDIPEIASLKLPRFSVDKADNPVAAPGPTSGPDFLERQFGRVPNLPAPVGLPAPSASLGGSGGGSRAGGGGGGGGGGDFATGGFDSSYSGELFSMEALAARGQVINITVNAAVAEASLGDKIVEALTDYNRRSGPIDIAVA
jgi:uncharacterized membrane protein YgcG